MLRAVPGAHTCYAGRVTRPVVLCPRVSCARPGTRKAAAASHIRPDAAAVAKPPVRERVSSDRSASLSGGRSAVRRGEDRAKGPERRGAG